MVDLYVAPGLFPKCTVDLILFDSLLALIAQTLNNTISNN